VPGQIYLWSSSFLQSCYYFDELMRSPFKAFKRYRQKKKEQAELAAGIADKRVITSNTARPSASTPPSSMAAHWLGAVHVGIRKSGVSDHAADHDPAALWEPLAITLIAETAVATGILVTVAKGHRLEYFFKGLLVTPLRYAVLLFELVTIGRFAADLWIFRNRRWRK